MKLSKNQKRLLTLAALVVLVVIIVKANKKNNYSGYIYADVKTKKCCTQCIGLGNSITDCGKLCGNPCGSTGGAQLPKQPKKGFWEWLFS